MSYDKMKEKQNIHCKLALILARQKKIYFGGEIRAIWGKSERIRFKKRDDYISTLDGIGLWIDSKNNEN
ncbi:9670_t:CDS:2 [Rhizophagus irregularis]|nr:9670_t:CDS:2 [Rhizophagus irregularis]